MGGYGALKLSMKNTELFSSCIALSSGTFTDEERYQDNTYDHYFENLYGPKLEGTVSEHWKANSPLHLIDIIENEKLRSVNYFIDCGDDDFLYRGNSALHVKLRDFEIPHEYRVRQGGHQWSYWRSGLKEGLKFVSDKFHR